MEEKKKCKYCQSEIDKKAKVCPNCRKKQNHTVRNVVLGFIGFIIVCALILGGGDTTTVSNNNVSTNTGNESSNVSTNNSVQNNNAKQEKFTVIEHSTSNDGYWTYIVGTIKNNTNKNYSYVQIEINLYDAEGNLVNSTLDNINNLEANGTWKFKAITTDDFSTYKIKDVTGW